MGDEYYSYVGAVGYFIDDPTKETASISIYSDFNLFQDMIDPILEIANANYATANDMTVTPSFWIYAIDQLEDYE